MTFWLFVRDEQSFREVIEEEAFRTPEASDFPTEAKIAVYLTDEDALVGPFEYAEKPSENGDCDILPIEIPAEVDKAEISQVALQDMFSQGGEFDGRDETIIETKLRHASTTVDIASENEDSTESEDEPSQSLLDISKATERIDASSEDFSGEKQGRVILDGNNFKEAEFRYADLEGASFDDCDLRGADFTGAILKDVTFLRADLERTDFSDAKLHGATFDGNLSQCEFQGAVMEGVDFRKATLQEADFTGVHMPDAKLQGTRPREAVFDHANLQDIKTDDRTDFSNASFRDATLDETVFSKCDLTHGDFEGASLVGSDLSKPTLDDTSFISADLRDATLGGQTAEGVDFTRANLSETTLMDCSFDDARFHGARMNGANARRSNLSGSIMSEVKARNAKFDGSNLERVSFAQAELFDASFKGAALYGAVLQSARIGSDTQFHGDFERNQGTDDSEPEQTTGLASEDGQTAHRESAEEGNDESDGYVLYDPRDSNPTPDGVADSPDPIVKAGSFYRTLETVMQQNAYGEKTGGYLINRKEMDRRKHLDQGRYGRYIVNRVGYYSCKFGESIRNLFIWAGIILLLPGGVYPTLGLSHPSRGTINYSEACLEAFLFGFQFSVSAFTGLGYGQYTVGNLGESLATAQTGLGVVWFALFVFVLTRRTER